VATYVIVHGANGGGYQWQKVAGLLRAGGHAVFTPTLTGLGERVHLAHPGVDVDLHVSDILNVLKYEELSDVILCGHSYGGVVITGVAERAAGLLLHLVYIDGMVLRDGESAMDLAAAVMPASTVAAINEMVATAGKGWFIPASPVRSDGVPCPLATPQPVKTFETRLTVRNPQAAALPHTYIYCTETSDTWVNKSLLAASAARAREVGWAYYELPTGHAVYDTMPKELTTILTSLT
jgi:pimeloyl-ACP methyl ester carboxylesterase